MQLLLTLVIRYICRDPEKNVRLHFALLNAGLRSIKQTIRAFLFFFFCFLFCFVFFVVVVVVFPKNYLTSSERCSQVQRIKSDTDTAFI